MGKVDTHVHTQFSGYSKLGALKFPESVISPEVQVDNARRLGYDVLCITDHDETAGGFVAEKYARQFDDIEIIVGEEVMTNEGEVIGLFLNERVKPMLSPEETIDIIREQGGLTIAPHPFSVHVEGLKERCLDLDLDGIETINGGHPDEYSNRFAQMVCDRHPGRWAEISGSDAHSVYTSGFNWTEFDGNTAEDFRRAVLNKTTRAVGRPAPVFTQVQWSVEVVLGGQKLLMKALKGPLEGHPDDQLINKINSISNPMKGAGLVGGTIYLFPPIVCLATLLSTKYLEIKAREAIKQIPERLKAVDRILREVDAKAKELAAMGITSMAEFTDAINPIKNDRMF